MRPNHRRSGERGQGLVEFSMIVPVVLLILLGMLEFGFAMDHSATIGNATREGARMGSALVNGGGTLGCSAGQSPNAANVDGRIVAAVSRILAAPGSRISLADVTEIRIYKATSTGTETAGMTNVWVYSAAGTTTTDGFVNFVPSGGQPWTACSRSYLWTVCGTPTGGALGNQCPPDSIGVGIKYNYRYVTPLAAAMGFFGGSSAATLGISERAVMAMNPS